VIPAVVNRRQTLHFRRDRHGFVIPAAVNRRQIAAVNRRQTLPRPLRDPGGRELSSNPPFTLQGTPLR